MGTLHIKLSKLSKKTAIYFYRFTFIADNLRHNPLRLILCLTYICKSDHLVIDIEIGKPQYTDENAVF